MGYREYAAKNKLDVEEVTHIEKDDFVKTNDEQSVENVQVKKKVSKSKRKSKLKLSNEEDQSWTSKNILEKL